MSKEEEKRNMWEAETPHCSHRDFNHPNAWGKSYHIGHPNKNALAYMEALLREMMNE